MAHTFDEKTTAQLNRAKEHFEQMFGKADRYLAVHAPGRSEIAGNHTDHEGGHVIAGALDVAIDAICAPNSLGVIRVASVGYDPFEVDYTNLEPTEAEYLSTKAIVRGMAANLVKLGFEPSGFDMAVVSNVPGGGGLSSS
ncbi:MAG: galactokinase family protein, partial [Atopobium sp.]|nr:galactokinase family protein [Atopobium sp.]